MNDLFSKLKIRNEKIRKLNEEKKQLDDAKIKACIDSNPIKKSDPNEMMTVSEVMEKFYPRGRYID